MATACTQGKRKQHGKPHHVVGRDDQPVAGDGQAGRFGVAERPVVMLKPSNVGGGEGALVQGRYWKWRSTGDWGNSNNSV